MVHGGRNSFSMLGQDQTTENVSYVRRTVPSVTFASSGNVIMAFHGVQCQSPTPPSRLRNKIAIATGPHWSGPYTIISKEPVFGWMVPDDWPPSLVTPGQVVSKEAITASS